MFANDFLCVVIVLFIVVTVISNYGMRVTEGMAPIKDTYFLLSPEDDFQNNICSPKCCSRQWGSPHIEHSNQKLPSDLVPSRMTCNSYGQSSGCMCISKKQASFLYSRGGNSMNTVDYPHKPLCNGAVHDIVY